MNIESYHKLRRIDRLQNVMKLRLAQADRRAAMPVCPDCGERHPPSPIVALLRRLGDSEPVGFAPGNKEPKNGHH